jgi:2',3'-cyclic-nucleotide 2'-phosphodiesterase (5'-nucleotidase family)
MAKGPSLRIVAINDVYSLENLPRLRTLVLHHQQVDPADVLLVTLAGDFVAPSVLSSLDAGRGMVDCMNAVGVTHAIFGNHEDDIPAEQLPLRVGELQATWLATNVHGFAVKLPESDVVVLARPGGRSVRVGLVGVVMTDPTVYRDAPFGGAALEPANDAARREAARLVREDGCACVIPLTHQTLEEDRELARTGAPFAVVIGGHEHEPHIEDVGGTWLEKAGSDATHAALVDLTWPEAAPPAGAPDLPTVRVHLEDVAAYDEDAPLRARVDRHMARVHELESAPLVTLGPGETLSSVGTRMRQTSLGTLVCNSVKRALRAEACLFNGGAIRASREYTGRLTYGDVKAEIPFDNEVVVARLPGAVVASAIRASRAHAPAESGGFLQVDDGITIAHDGNTVLAIAGEPLSLSREYDVALVRNLLTGLDHIEPLVRFATQFPARVPPVGSGREIKLVLVDAFSVDLWRHLGGFDAVDLDHDGMVTEPELAAAIGRATATAPSDVAAELVLHAIDGDRDHAISREESEKLGRG